MNSIFIPRKPFIIYYLLFFIFIAGIPAQADPADARGDRAIAERYVLWVEDAIKAGQWHNAHAALERAADFADVSSDISYLLALARSRVNQARGPVLQALQQAFITDIWNRYSEAEARLLEAGQLIALRRFRPALDSITAGVEALRSAGSVTGGETAEFEMLRLTALKGLADTAGSAGEFRRAITEAMEFYPRDPRPLRIFFNYTLNRQPVEDDFILMGFALQRLPFLLETDPELAVMAAPFIEDTEEARRLVAAYRSGSHLSVHAGSFVPVKTSIVPALNLGLLDDNDAVRELFAAVTANSELVLDRDLITNVFKLLRGYEGRDFLVRTLLSFTGVITADENFDGIPESRAVYRQGVLHEFYFDADQDGVNDMIVLFNTNSPYRAEVTVLPSAGPPETLPPGYPAAPNPALRALVTWERYPSVQRVVLDTETFLFSPGNFSFAPVNFEELCATDNYAGLLFPQYNRLSTGINRRQLVLSAYMIQRPGTEFDGSVEQVYLKQGVPVRAEEILNGRVVSVTEYLNGRPVIQRLDMDLDGILETIRHF